jgi:hypothetical protein
VSPTTVAAPPEAPPAPLEPPPLLWDSERADDRASQALRYLAERYPECAGRDVLTPCHDAAEEYNAHEKAQSFFSAPHRLRPLEHYLA